MYQRLKQTALWVFAVATLCSMQVAAAQGAATQTASAKNIPAAPAVQNTAFRPGEKLVFRISYGGWLTAGRAEFSISPRTTTYKGRRCYVINGNGYSEGAFNWVYKVRDSFKSFVDTQKLIPYAYHRVVKEGGYEFEDKVLFDHKKSLVRTGKKGDHAMQGITHDMVSAFYYARCLGLKDFTVGQTYDLPVFLDDKTYNLGLTVLGRETIKTSLGTFRCIKISPKLITGRVFKEGEEGMILWVTDDENYIPLRITSPLSVGSVYVELESYSGLRNPVAAKLN